jgi:hypothetical protein
MPTASAIQHYFIENPCLPYRTFISPTDKTPSWSSGSSNLLTSLKGYTERRPGFATAVEGTPTTFTGQIVRQFTWRKWGGSFYTMVNEVTGSASKVYYFQHGTSASFTLLHADSSSTNPFGFVDSNNTVYFGNGNTGNMKKWDGTTLSNWGITAPSIVATVSTTGTGISAAVGYYYVYTYYNTNTGHESSPSGISACTGVFSNKTVSVGYTASGDAQVTHIKIYRTLDGGNTAPEKMRLLTTVVNGTSTYSDTTSDTTLAAITLTAPAALSNDPPPASTPLAWHAGRIWMYINAKTYFTAFEEAKNGVPEESVPSATSTVNAAGNVYNWNSEVTSLAAMEDGIAVYLGGRVWKVEGDSLDSFRRYRLLDKRGARAAFAVTSLGSTLAWIDSSRQIWVSDLGEIGKDIRTDIKTLDLTKASIAIHISGEFHWIVVADGANGKLYVYDIDTNQWMPPWNVGTTIGVVYSAETAVGTTDLFISRNGTKVLKLNSTTYQDDGNSYTGAGRTNLFPITGKQENPDWVGLVDTFSVERNTVALADVKQLNDDDPSLGTYTSIFANEIDPPKRSQQANIVKKTYPSGSSLASSSSSATAQRVSFDLSWAAANSNFKLYSMDIGFYGK